MGFFTTADGNVIGHSTVGIDATNSLTRINASVVYAALVARTVGVQNTFRPARAEWISDIISRADAIDGSVLLLALGVCTTWVGIARSRWLNHIGLDCYKLNQLLIWILCV